MFKPWKSEAPLIHTHGNRICISLGLRSNAIRVTTSKDCKHEAGFVPTVGANNFKLTIAGNTKKKCLLVCKKKTEVSIYFFKPLPKPVVIEY